MPSSKITSSAADSEPDPFQAFEEIASRPEWFGRSWEALEIAGAVPATLPVPPTLNPALQDRLKTIASAGLYPHQIDSIERLISGQSVVVTTATAMGKSWCFQIPIVETILSSPGSTALIIVPTKALANDQIRALHTWRLPGIRPFSFDGDTGHEDRQAARRDANVLVTTPDMLSKTILPDHKRWARYLGNLRYVVIDELHTARGVFGTHVAFTLTRLERLVELHGGGFSYCATSATIGDAPAFAELVTGRELHWIAGPTLGQGDRKLVGWSRPFLETTGALRSPLTNEVSALLAHWVDSGFSTIAFAPTRDMAERITMAARERSSSKATIATYRAGFLPRERQQLESQLRDGTLHGVVATSALELGVDLPGFDVAILAGFPGTLASFWQQVGRAGRGTRRSVAMLVEGNDQLDGFYRRHMTLLLTPEFETPVISRTNTVVMAQHLGAAASEHPLTRDAAERFGPGSDAAAATLLERGAARVRNGSLYWVADPRDAPPTSIRGTGFGEIEIFDSSDQLIGRSSNSSALFVGAGYLHQGMQYEVTDLDLEARWARVRVDTRNVWTQADRTSDMEVLRTDHSCAIGAAQVATGLLRVTEQHLGYRVVDRASGKVVERVRSDRPSAEKLVSGVWITYAVDDLAAACARMLLEQGRHAADPYAVVGPALHAAEHALIGMIPRYAMADRWDVGGLSRIEPSPSISIFEAMPGGTGVSERMFSRVQEWVADTASLISSCTCRTGCPNCIQSPKCGNFNEFLDKDGAIAVLRLIRDPVDA